MTAELEADFLTFSPQDTAKKGQFAWFSYTVKATVKQMILDHLMPDPKFECWFAVTEEELMFHDCNPSPCLRRSDQIVFGSEWGRFQAGSK